MDKASGNRLRRMAKRQALILRRSPTRDRRAVDYGQYAAPKRSWWVSWSTLTCSGRFYTFSAEAVEGVLSGR